MAHRTQASLLDELLSRRTSGGLHTRQAGAAPLTRAALCERQQCRSNSAAPKGIGDHQLIEPCAWRNGELPSIGYMYETDERSVNRSQVKIRPQVGHQIPKAPQGGALGRGHGHPAGGEQIHDRREIGAPATPDVNASISHATCV